MLLHVTIVSTAKTLTASATINHTHTLILCKRFPHFNVQFRIDERNTSHAEEPLRQKIIVKVDCAKRLILSELCILVPPPPTTHGCVQITKQHSCARGLPAQFSLHDFSGCTHECRIHVPTQTAAGREIVVAKYSARLICFAIHGEQMTQVKSTHHHRVLTFLFRIAVTSGNKAQMRKLEKGSGPNHLHV